MKEFGQDAASERDIEGRLALCGLIGDWIENYSSAEIETAAASPRFVVYESVPGKTYLKSSDDFVELRKAFRRKTQCVSCYLSLREKHKYRIALDIEQWKNIIFKNSMKIVGSEYVYITSYVQTVYHITGKEATYDDVRIDLGIDTKKFFYYIKQLSALGIVEKRPIDRDEKKAGHRKKYLLVYKGKLRERQAQCAVDNKRHACLRLANMSMYSQIKTFIVTENNGATTRQLRDMFGINIKFGIRILTRFAKEHGLVRMDEFVGKEKIARFFTRKKYEEYKRRKLEAIGTKIEMEVDDLCGDIMEDPRIVAIRSIVGNRYVPMDAQFTKKISTVAHDGDYVMDKKTIIKLAGKAGLLIKKTSRGKVYIGNPSVMQEMDEEIERMEMSEKKEVSLEDCRSKDLGFCTTVDGFGVNVPFSAEDRCSEFLCDMYFHVVGMPQMVAVDNGFITDKGLAALFTLCCLLAYSNGSAAAVPVGSETLERLVEGCAGPVHVAVTKEVIGMFTLRHLAAVVFLKSVGLGKAAASRNLENVETCRLSDDSVGIYVKNVWEKKMTYQALARHMAVLEGAGICRATNDGYVCSEAGLRTALAEMKKHGFERLLSFEENARMHEGMRPCLSSYIGIEKRIAFYNELRQTDQDGFVRCAVEFAKKCSTRLLRLKFCRLADRFCVRNRTEKKMSRLCAQHVEAECVRRLREVLYSKNAVLQEQMTDFEDSEVRSAISKLQNKRIVDVSESAAAEKTHRHGAEMHFVVGENICYSETYYEQMQQCNNVLKFAEFSACDPHKIISRIAGGSAAQQYMFDISKMLVSVFLKYGALSQKRLFERMTMFTQTEIVDVLKRWPSLFSVVGGKAGYVQKSSKRVCYVFSAGDGDCISGAPCEPV